MFFMEILIISASNLLQLEQTHQYRHFFILSTMITMVDDDDDYDDDDEDDDDDDKIAINWIPSVLQMI